MTDNNIADQNSYPVKMHGQSGALIDLLKKIDDPKIHTLEDVIQFKKNYAAMRQKKVADGVAEIKLQVTKLITELNQLKQERDDALKSKSAEQNQVITRLEEELLDSHQQCNFFTAFYFRIKKWAQENKIKNNKNKFQKIIHSITNDYSKRIASMADKINHTQDNIQSLAEDAMSSELRRLDGLNSTIEKEKYLVYGAIGETKVINELKKLPQTYHIINDFKLEINPPLYNRTEDDRIYSIQADHLVVGPTGIFVIETKYWSNKSMSSDVLFSPVKQVKRAGFALFVLLNDAVKSRHIMKLVSNWGERKISLRQIVATVNSAPHAEFQFVKVLRIENLNSYITYSKQEFTAEEIQDIVGYLLHVK